ncbi:MAG: arylformamidase [Chloroflexi bacterium]|nr:MAG: arylformamidase [Chloroflexota bacterium]
MDERLWIDVTAPVTTGMAVWPGDPAVNINRVAEVERGDLATVSHLDMGSHTGTHVEAPSHFLPGGLTIDEMPLEATNGKARVIGIEDSATVGLSELLLHDPQPGERLLFKTANSSRQWYQEPFVEDFVALSLEAAHLLAERQLLMVGIDYLSVSGFHDDTSAIHTTLLKAGIWIVEGLALQGIAPGAYEMVCLPLKLQGTEGAPARAMLRPLFS